jgi:hypothetical protein
MRNGSAKYTNIKIIRILYLQTGERFRTFAIFFSQSTMKIHLYYFIFLVFYHSK